MVAWVLLEEAQPKGKGLRAAVECCCCHGLICKGGGGWVRIWVKRGVLQEVLGHGGSG